jgi:hypothetical protein
VLICLIDSSKLISYIIYKILTQMVGIIIWLIGRQKSQTKTTNPVPPGRRLARLVSLFVIVVCSRSKLPFSLTTQHSFFLFLSHFSVLYALGRIVYRVTPYLYAPSTEVAGRIYHSDIPSYTLYTGIIAGCVNRCRHGCYEMNPTRRVDQSIRL